MQRRIKICNEFLLVKFSKILIVFAISFKPIKIMLNADTLMLVVPIGSTNIRVFKSSIVLFCKCDEFRKYALFFL